MARQEFPKIDQLLVELRQTHNADKLVELCARREFDQAHKLAVEIQLINFIDRQWYSDGM